MITAARKLRCALGHRPPAASGRSIERQLWRCGTCGRRFANRNQRHSCGLEDLDQHFEGRSTTVRAIFDTFLTELRSLGPVTVLAEKTRIAFQTRMSFGQLTIRNKWVTGHLVLARRVTSALFTRVETISARNHVHHFRLRAANDLSAELRGYMAEAYRVGNQQHLRGRHTAMRKDRQGVRCG
jgi:uncharacterized protein DUF5655